MPPHLLQSRNRRRLLCDIEYGTTPPPRLRTSKRAVHRCGIETKDIKSSTEKRCSERPQDDFCWHEGNAERHLKRIATLDYYSILANMFSVSLLPAVCAIVMCQPRNFRRKRGPLFDACTNPVWPILLLITNLAALCFCGTRAQLLSSAEHWKPTKAIILQVAHRTSWGKHTRHYPVCDYRFEVDGKTYTGTAMNSSDDSDETKYPLGSTVEIYYNPQSPSQSSLTRGWDIDTWFSVVTSLVGIVCSLGTLVQTFRNRSML